jgi:hypothetical protein
MRKLTSSFIIVLASLLGSMFLPLPAHADAGATAAQKSAAGKRIIGTPKTMPGLGFNVYPGAMLQLTDSIDDCADAKNDRTTFIYSTLDTIAKVKEFYGMGPRDNKLGAPEDGRSLQVYSGEGGTRIAIRHFPPQAPKPTKAGKK